MVPTVSLPAVAWRFRLLPVQAGAAAAARLHCGVRAANRKHPLPAVPKSLGGKAKGPGCPFAGWLHLPTPGEGGRPPRRGGGPGLSSESPGARLSYKWLLRPARRGARRKLAASLQPPRRSAGAKMLQRTPAGPPGSALPHSSRLRSLSPRSRGALGTPSPSARRAPSFAFCHPTALPPRALGGRAAPLAGPQEARAVAWVLPARNRFTRDQLPGWETVKTCLAEAAANRYPYFLPLVASPRPKLLPPPIWQKPQSFLVVNLFPQAPSPAARQGLDVCRRERRLQLFARVAKCKKSNINCLLLQTHNLSP